MSSYLFSDPSASRVLASPAPPSNPSAARSQLSATLLSMGFPLSRVHALVSLINPSQANAVEVALELLTRDEEDDDEEDDADDDDEADLAPAAPPRRPATLRQRLHPARADDDVEEEVSDVVSVLTIMTGCSAAEAAHALQRERDVNAAAEYILQRQEHKEMAWGTSPSDGAEAEAEERRREQARARRRERRREAVAAHRRAEEQGGMDGKRFLHFGDALLVQHALSEEMLTVDSDANAVTIAPYAHTPAYGSPSISSTRGAAITSPLTLPLSQSSNTPRASGALPPSAAPPALSLAASPSPTSLSSRSLLSSSPSLQRRAPASVASSAFFPSSPQLSGGPASALPLPQPTSTPSSQSTDRPALFHSLSLSPLRSPGKPRSFSTPRKSSHPLSLSLPSHHRYHLIIRRAPRLNPPTPAETSSDDEEGGPVMSGDSVVLETYERCFLCVEADGRVGCNRTAPVTQQMHLTVRTEEKAGDAHSEGGGQENGLLEDIRALEANAVVSLSTLDRNYVTVEHRHAMAVQAQPSAAHRFVLGLAHRSASHHRRHRYSASASSPVTVPAAPAAAPVPTAAALHWAYLRSNMRLLALAVLQSAIAEKQTALLQKQRAQRLHREDAKRLCSICLDRVCEVVLLDCGHSCACEQCAATLKECVVCRQRVQRVVVIRAA